MTTTGSESAYAGPKPGYFDLNKIHCPDQIVTSGAVIEGNSRHGNSKWPPLASIELGFRQLSYIYT